MMIDPRSDRILVATDLWLWRHLTFGENCLKQKVYWSHIGVT